MFDLEKYPHLANPWLIVVGGTGLAAIFLFVFRLVIMKRLRKVTSSTRFTVDTVLVSAISAPLTLITFAILLVLAEHLVVDVGLLPKSQLGFASDTAKIISIAAIILFLDRFARGFISGYSEKSPTIRNSKGVIQGLSRGLIILIGALVLLGTMGISVTPVIASLGITSLAVALALQPTLENFFSGVQLVMDKPIRVGDFIELSSGEQGFVERIGWRTTWIKMLQNNTVIIPNSDLSKSRIINYFYPAKELSVPVEVGIHYSSDLDHVERVALEVAREILVSHEWGVDDYNTFVLFTEFDSSSINMTVMLRAKEYFNRFWVKSAFIKALHKRFAEEGIVIPFPIRAINTDQESPVLPIRS
jgi:small-conductance mechanosensitive channel